MVFGLALGLQAYVLLMELTRTRSSLYSLRF